MERPPVILAPRLGPGSSQQPILNRIVSSVSIVRLRHALSFSLTNGSVGVLALVLRLILGLCLAMAPGSLPAKEKPKQAAAAGLAAPRFSQEEGVFTNEIRVELKGPSAAVIRFTLDGSDPDVASPAYQESAPLHLTNSVMLRARCFAAGQPPGGIASRHFLFAAPEALAFTSNLPLLFLHSFGQEISKELKHPVAVRLIAPGPGPGGGPAALAAPAAFAGRGLLSLRGRASLRYPKKSYTLKTVDDLEDPVKFEPPGLDKGSEWVLYAPFPDKTLIRDALAYELSNAIGRWAPHTRFVEVFLNETGGRITRQDYLGVYVLVERIKTDKHRVNVESLTPEDLAEPAVTGGYIFKKDHGDNGDNGPMTAGAYPAFTAMNNSRSGYPTGPGFFPGDVAGFQPPYRGATSSGRTSSSSSRARPGKGNVVTNHVGVPTRRDPGTSTSTRTVYRSDEEESVEVIEEEQFRDNFRTSVRTNKFFYVEPEPDELNSVQRAWLRGYVDQLEKALYGRDFKDPTRGYAGFLDVPSSIDYHLLVETTKNVDGFRFSTFFHKDRGGKVKMGPLWDWNLSFGNCNGKQGYMPEWWLWPQLDDKEYSWFRRLFEDPTFAQAYGDRWAERRAGVFATPNVLARVDRMAGELKEAQERNYQRWPILGLAVNPNWYVGETYEEEITWLKEWIAKRLEWMERQFVPVPRVDSAAGQPVVLKAGSDGAFAGVLFYTLDGTDPRTPTGGVAKTARRYEGPVEIPPGGTLFARAAAEPRWSGPLVLGKRR